MENNNRQEMTKEELQQILEQVRGEFQSALDQRLAAHEQKVSQKLAHTEARVIRWVVGVFLSAVVVMSTLVGTYTMMIVNKL